MPISAIAVPSDNTCLSNAWGGHPTASRMPNSRVRVLTEKASTPAMPMTAINSAIPANPVGQVQARHGTGSAEH
jgi:hypothetical protein